ncbi:MAG TPA: hypothetical protein VKF59_04965 [Candidatus Dormibacteraeota bacterium]|nr:hypothetical protein [Candidatus Dormibacteraeota bacterium]
MDDIVRTVADRTGLTDEQAQQAVDTVVGMLKGRLPEPASSMIDRFVGGGETAAGDEAEPGQEAAGEAPGKLGQATEAVKNIFNR